MSRQRGGRQSQGSVGEAHDGYSFAEAAQELSGTRRLIGARSDASCQVKTAGVQDSNVRTLPVVLRQLQLHCWIQDIAQPAMIEICVVGTECGGLTVDMLILLFQKICNLDEGA